MNRSKHMITRGLLGLIAALSMAACSSNGASKTDNGNNVVDNGNNVVDNGNNVTDNGGDIIVDNGNNVTDNGNDVADNGNNTVSCQSCHSAENTTWKGSGHADSQKNAPELAGDVGHSPEEQIADEDCISCHGPRAVLANGGMTEAEALGYFYTTATESGVSKDGKAYDVGDFYPGTVPQHQSEWRHINCQTCHSKTQGMTSDSPLALALFDSHYVDPDTGAQGVEKPVAHAHELCGQCHGSLHVKNQGTDDSFPGGSYEQWQKWAALNPAKAKNWKGTNHLLHDGWKLSKHGNTQEDVASELGEERTGQTPEEVTNGADPEVCVACHAPTAVEANGGMSEAQALDYFFTTTDGKFTADTATKHTDEWPDVDCVACHNQHDPKKLAYFDSSTRKHVPMKNAEELCGQCHGNLRFPDTDHLSYNILQGTGVDGSPAPGVPDIAPSMGATCTDCHMAVDSTTWPGEHHFNQYMTHGHTWKVIVNGGDKSHHPENHPGWTGWSMGALAGDMADHGDGAGNGDAPHMASCTNCHKSMDAAKARADIEKYQNEFQTLDTTAQTNVSKATAAMVGVNDSTLQAKLDEAVANLAYADSDESGGFHNHDYLMALLNDANSKALEVLSALANQ